MKKTLIVLSMGLLLAGMLASCGNSENPVEPHGRPVVDYGPVEFYVMIKNADGVDLLDSTKHETFLKDISVRYNDQTYRFPIWTKSANTRLDVPTFKGLELHRYYSYKTFSLTDDWCLVFGELDGNKTADYAITLKVGEKSIPLSCRNILTPNYSQGYPDASCRYYVDGELLTDESGKCGLYHFLYTSTGDLEYVPSEYE